jgi:hypothetical protein
MLDILEYAGWVALTALCLNQLGGALNMDEWQFKLITQPPAQEFHLEEPPRE